MSRKEILYPVFLECCSFTEDSFWKNTFEDLAYGKTPYGSYISKDSICMNQNNRKFSYKIERKDPKVLFNEVYKLFTDKLGIMSKKEKNSRSTDFYKIEKNIKNSRQTWADIRKKNVRDILIERYAVEMKKKHNLTIAQTKYLLSLILIAMMFKAISSKNIIYADDRIVDITGIEIKNGEVTLTNPLYSLESTPTIEPVGPKKRMSDNWERYLKNLTKIEKKIDAET